LGCWYQVVLPACLGGCRFFGGDVWLKLLFRLGLCAFGSAFCLHAGFAGFGVCVGFRFVGWRVLSGNPATGSVVGSWLLVGCFLPFQVALLGSGGLAPVG